MTGINDREFGELIADVRYLKSCCERVEKDIEGAKTRTTAILTSIIILLAGTVVNLILTLTK